MMGDLGQMIRRRLATAVFLLVLSNPAFAEKVSGVINCS